MSRDGTMNRDSTIPGRAVVLLLVVLALNLAAWMIGNGAEGMAPPAGEKAHSLSFAPFRNGQSPLKQIYPTAEQIEQDMALLAPRTERVRVYTSLEGMEAVPALARKYGLKVTLGAWLGAPVTAAAAATNEAETKSAIELATAYPDVIDKVIVGNEVLLRGELKPAELAAFIRRVRDAVEQPVGYADVWEFWLKYPEMAAEVDFIAIHLLPYWENDPVGIEGVAARILESYEAVRARFPDKPIMIAEAGWPTAGRMRGPARASVINQVRFFEIFARLAREHRFDYNLIEAFDQTWKAEQEGWTGAAWGIFTAERTPKVMPGTPILEKPHWPWLAMFATLLGIAVAVLTRKGWTGAAGLPMGAQLALTFLATNGVVLAADYAFAHRHFPLHLSWQAALVLAQAIFALGWMLPRSPLFRRAALAGFGLLVAGAVAQTAGLILEGRYLDFPLTLYGGPALTALALRALPLPGGSQGHDRRWLDGAIPGALLLGGALLWREGVANGEAVAWCALLLAFAIGLRPVLRRLGQAPAHATAAAP